MSMQIALKVNVGNWRGALEGVPRLVELLRRHEAQASFFVALGPDHSGRLLKRALNPDFARKAWRMSMLSHLGGKALLYGTLLPGPHIGRGCAGMLRDLQQAGFEIGLHGWNPVAWQEAMATAPASWVHAELAQGLAAYQEIFGQRPRAHAAPGWRMNAEALRLTQRLGFDYASDSRGTAPFMPVWQGAVIHCPQIPTTLPPLDELIGMPGIELANVHEHLLQLTAPSATKTHVFTLDASMEGLRLLPVLEKLLQGWREQGYTLTSTRAIFETLASDTLPRHEVQMVSLPGRLAPVLHQGAPFLQDWTLAGS